MLGRRAGRRSTRPIHLADYDPAWPRCSSGKRPDPGRLGTRVRRLEHAGSTSVPGLAAKPIIDIVLAVPDSADEPAYVPDLEAAGYVLHIREPDWFEHRVFKGPARTSTCTSSPRAAPEIDRMLAFRDWLRTHDEDRDLYERDQARAGGARLGLRPALRRREGRGRRGDPRAGHGRALTAPPALTSSAPVDTVRART